MEMRYDLSMHRLNNVYLTNGQYLYDAAVNKRTAFVFHCWGFFYVKSLSKNLTTTSLNVIK